MTTTTIDQGFLDLLERAKKLRLHGLAARWSEVCTLSWVLPLIEWEEKERKIRSLKSRIKNASIGHFKPIADFDWKHPTKIDRQIIEELFEFNFLDEASNLVFIGPNGVGKTMLVQNLAYQALLRGTTVRFCTASEMLNDLAAQESAAGLKRRLKHYVSPKILVVDELGYLSYDNRHADLLYEVVSQRYNTKCAIILTTNKPFSQWNQVFQNSSSVVTLIDRLCHRVEIVSIEASSYRAREAQESAAKKRARRRKKKN